MWGSRFTPTVATAQKSRTLAVSQQRVWEVIEDPAQLVRWWPGVTRTEEVRSNRWTEVHAGKRGRAVRLDFHLLQSSPPSYRLWEQQLAGSPFERVLEESVTEVALERVTEGTLVTIAVRQKLRGYSRTGALVLRQTAGKQLSQALDGLQRMLT